MKSILKAIVGWASSEVLALGTWVGTLAPGPITEREWITLGIALVGPLLVGAGVYKTTNAPSPVAVVPPSPPEASQVPQTAPGAGFPTP